MTAQPARVLALAVVLAAGARFPDALDIVLRCSGLGTLVGTALALLLAMRHPGLTHWRLIGFFTFSVRSWVSCTPSRSRYSAHMRRWLPTVIAAVLSTAVAVALTKTLSIDPTSDTAVLLVGAATLVTGLTATIGDVRRGVHGPTRRELRRRGARPAH